MTNASLAGMSLMTKGLITTVCGLAGVLSLIHISEPTRH